MNLTLEEKLPGQVAACLYPSIWSSQEDPGVGVTLG